MKLSTAFTKHLAFLVFTAVLTMAFQANGETAKPDSSTNVPNKTDSKPKLLYRFQGAKVKVLAQDGSQLRVTREDSAVVFSVADPALKKEVATFHKGDIVDLEYDKAATGNTLKSINISIKKITPRQRIWMLLGVSVAIYIFLALLLRKNPKYLIVGEDNLYSNSKFQIVLWFYVLIVNYITINIFRGMIDLDLVGGIDIPANLLLLSGLSTITYGTAKGITQGKVDKSKEDAGQEKRIVADVGSERFPRDLFMNAAGQVDMADFQMVVLTLLTVGTYFVQVFSFLGVQELYSVVTLPDVDSTILAVFGLGQGAYLTKKFVGGINS